ncbi:alpha/beta fold hydrolase [Stackebrandtia nassauensis]|uniref:Alpha/beta hydrolase fold protein n=1 Tax=Stackebrandtia nassauensis (strain DSM 44728 / CIP 108903 / NRRL B-16338 / NBRC 102104 / LLR-40K-21) TaxID=446470 RepID=D3PXU2_STANL|nr:alpha/beta hydrolase [Stackebrandtia nassauensis]ADD43422.1 alpha/beta hydrolase fold protein [Stackebrandtia nassauensis DSM 44728]
MWKTKNIDLSAGTIDYLDTGGTKPVLVLVHGLLMDETLWTDVVAELAPEYRCVVPVLPLGAHRHAMSHGADLSLPGVARLLAEFVDRLGLTDVTLVGNDTGGAVVQLLMAEPAASVARAVLVSCEAFDNLPPGLTGRALVLTGKLPPRLFGLFMRQLRLKPMRRLPFVFGWLTRRGDAVTAGWVTPVIGDVAVARDATRTLRSIASNRKLLLDNATRLPGFDRPVLVVWAKNDRVMPPEHGERLAELLPDARLTVVDDTDALIPLDQPTALAGHIREFVAERAAH